MVPHAGVVNLLLGARLRYNYDPAMAFGVPTPYVFDVSVYNIFASLVVHCGSCRLLLDGSSLNDPITRVYNLKRIAAVPSVLSVARPPPSVRHVEVGGEALTESAVENVPTGAALYNYYGPTEVAIWATRIEVALSKHQHRLASIGRPLAN
eukprot:38120-Prymnesium_polylepis.1